MLFSLSLSLSLSQLELAFFIVCSLQVMRTWKGTDTTDDERERLGLKPGRHSKLSLVDQFLLVMVSI